MQRRAIVEVLGDNADLLRRWRRSRERRQNRGIQPRHIAHILEVDKLEQVTILDAILDPHILMLMIEIFTPFSEAHGCESPPD